MRSITVILILCLSICGFGQELQQKKYSSFRVGEKLTYIIRFGFIHGGEAEAELKISRFNNKPCYHAKFGARSIGLTDKLFRVRDYYESYFDMKSSLPYKAIRNVREGNFKFYNEAFFNHNDRTVYSQISDSTFVVPENILDMASLLYYIRNLDLRNLKEGDVIPIQTFFDDEIFPFDVRYKGKEEIKVRGETYRCLRFDPVVEPGRIFESEDDMSVWLSDDENLVPLRVRFDLIVGSLKIDLIEHKNLKYNLTSKL